MARFGNHRGFVNGIAWAPHSTVHICTAGSDRQALIWQMNHFNRDEPILAYTAEGEVFILQSFFNFKFIKPRKEKRKFTLLLQINQIHWSTNFHQWICICFNNNLEILRV
jgi:WD repeat-containing protein 68